MKKWSVVFAFFSISGVAVAGHWPQCNYTFIAPDASTIARYATLANQGYQYATYVTGGCHMHATHPLKIGSGERETIQANCAPYLLYVTFTKTPQKINPNAPFVCPTFSMGILHNNTALFAGEVEGAFDKDVAQVSDKTNNAQLVL